MIKEPHSTNVDEQEHPSIEEIKTGKKSHIILETALEGVKKRLDAADRWHFQNISKYRKLFQIKFSNYFIEERISKEQYRRNDSDG
jgi:hypothetical protein